MPLRATRYTRALDVAALRAELTLLAWQASRYTARHPTGAPTCCGPISGGACTDRPRFRPMPGAMLFVVCDGLSATAVQRHAVTAVAPCDSAPASGAVAPIVVAEQGRVALGDDIGEAMGAEAVAVLIGERPGLSAADSLGVYLTWQPRRGRTDAERNCISNIRPEGLSARSRGRQAAMADRRDAAASPDRHRAEGRAARCTARPGLTERGSDARWCGQTYGTEGGSNMPSASDAGLSRLHRAERSRC